MWIMINYPEVLSFFKNHLKEIDVETLWKKCEEELKF
jgi:hypothetical protein|tara:strand:+ start:2788 stop:2898 length:111 start_codon:yes stop_codon:yes gene_type:complete